MMNAPFPQLPARAAVAEQQQYHSLTSSSSRQALGDTPSTLHAFLRDRELGKVRRLAPSRLTARNFADVDVCFSELSKCITSLKDALDAPPHRNQMKLVADVVQGIITRMLENTTNPTSDFSVSPSKKQEREAFVALGGLDELMRLFSRPLMEPDARDTPQNFILRHADIWNEVLVIIRELIFAVPSLPVTTFSKSRIVFLFTLLAHSCIFENALNLIEEILAARPDTFNLASVPRFYSLVNSFSVRHLAHFCRVLSLVLFEPEDRQIMEGAHVLRSIDLLQLRRDRMSKKTNTVERNQVLIIEMPELLSKFVKILRIVNYGPQLADMINNNIIAQPPISHDLITFSSDSWSDFDQLDKIIQAETVDGRSPWGVGGFGNPGPPTAGATYPSCIGQNGVGHRYPLSAGALTYAAAAPSDHLVNRLLKAFAPGSGSRPDVSTLQKIVWLALDLDIAFCPSSGENLLFFQNDGEDEEDDEGGQAQQAAVAGAGAGADAGHAAAAAANRDLERERARAAEERAETERKRVVLLARSRQRRSSNGFASRKAIDAQSARMELMFHSMLLAPHQVEMLFVICTMLSGRRKVDAQNKLAALGLADVLLVLFERLSWDAPPFTGPNPLEHIHGPGCECNPESALRVQYLRLVHNFYDRDFLGNVNKDLLITASEREFMNRSFSMSAAASTLPANQLDSIHDRGLLSRVIAVLKNEQQESVYRFWLSSCLEAYLRGAGPREQIFIARSGVLLHAIEHVIDAGRRSAPNLQTSFDLLGEIIKNNRVTLEFMEQILSSRDEMFGQFMDIVMSNLIDSNVLLRSLYISVEHISDKEERAVDRPSDADCGTIAHLEWTAPGGNGCGPKAAYLTHTWIQFAPKPLLAIDPAKGESTSTPTPATSVGGGLLPLLAGASTASVMAALRKVSEGVSTMSAKLGLVAVKPTSPEESESTAETSTSTEEAGSTNGIVVAAADDTSGFFTPPEAPKFARDMIAPDPPNVTMAAATMPPPPPGQPLSTTPAESVAPGEPRREWRLGLGWDSVRPALRGGWALPDGILRIGLFLSSERESVLLRLMDTVTVRTVNHENICCLNTALLLLLFAHRRNQLSSTLQKVRKLADERAELARGFRGDPMAEKEAAATQEDENDMEDGGEDTGTGESGVLYAQECAAVVSTTQSVVGEMDECCALGTCSPGAHELRFKRRNIRRAKTNDVNKGQTNLNSGETVMSNFRELLWFWREYYLRRGRDRLSIEFSSRIPFPYWQALVDLLCMDDGLPTSLAKQPPLLPLSPYFHPSRFGKHPYY